MSLIVLQASVERRLLDGRETSAGQTLASIETAGRDALTELRRMLGVLHSADTGTPLRPQPGLAQLPELVASACEAGLAVELVVEGEPRQVPAGLDLAAYRVVQESLTNVAKHVVGATSTATVRYRPGTLEIEVTDGGTPVPPAVPVPGAGQGLVGMRERVSLYGGTLDAGPDPAGGFHVRARIPLGAAP